MKEELVSIETSKLAKEKGFNIWCENSWKGNKVLPTNDFTNNHLFTPTQSLLQKWLREKYNIHIFIVPDIQLNYYLRIYQGDELYSETDYQLLGGMAYNSYEEALEIGLYEALKLI